MTLGQHELVRNRLGHPTEFLYDVRGNVTIERKFVTVNGSLVPVETVRTYDADDNELTIRDPLGHVTAKTYDANSNVLSVTVAQGSPDEMTTTYTYGPLNQLASTTDAESTTQRGTRSSRQTPSVARARAPMMREATWSARTIRSATRRGLGMTAWVGS